LQNFTGAASTEVVVDRLPTPDRVERWPVLWLYAVPIVLVHVLALLALWPRLFDVTAVVVCLVGVHVYGQAINIGYHRLFTHNSFKTPRWVERVILFMALGCLQDTPGRWVATHRYHHVHSDEPEDPHSPRAGLWWAHVGWLMVRNPSVHHIELYQKYARDVLSDPVHMKLEKYPLIPLLVYLLHLLILTGIGAGTAWLSTGDVNATLWAAASWFVWAGLVRTVLVWHITWSVNSLTHCFGYRNYQTGEDSRNNWLVALVTAGEGWHNNHHHDPSSASVRHRWWEWDVSYWEIRLMGMLGLASDIVRPRHERQAKIAAQHRPKP
jgi:stearoyl-CoA desaturase (delta-9 desaturase)